MKPASSLLIFAGLVALAAAAVVANAHQWHSRMLRRAELELARTELAHLSRVQAENTALRARQVSAAELARLRADHAALPRLRAELEALTKAPTPAR